MARALTNKAMLVLDVVRRYPEGVACKRVAKVIREELPPCGCGGKKGCRSCWGSGRVSFDYSRAYVELVRLEKRGLVQKRQARDEFGDEIHSVVWTPTDQPDPTDPLEQAFVAPAYGEEAGRA